MADFTICTAPQRSAEWFAARAGRLTGSCAWMALDFLKTGSKGESAKRRDYRFQLIAETLTGQPQDTGDGFVNAAMEHGIAKEPDARGAYEILTGRVARETGFLSHNTIAAGCSLDGHIGNFAGILELKCPKTATHLEYLRTGVVPEKYLIQITHNLWISGADWCDFMSFDDRLPEHMQVFLKRIERDQKVIDGYADRALAFLDEVAREVASLQGWNFVKGEAVPA